MHMGLNECKMDFNAYGHKMHASELDRLDWIEGVKTEFRIFEIRF